MERAGRSGRTWVPRGVERGPRAPCWASLPLTAQPALLGRAPGHHRTPRGHIGTTGVRAAHQTTVCGLRHLLSSTSRPDGGREGLVSPAPFQGSGREARRRQGRSGRIRAAAGPAPSRCQPRPQPLPGPASALGTPAKAADTRPNFQTGRGKERFQFGSSSRLL